MTHLATTPGLPVQHPSSPAARPVVPGTATRRGAGLREVVLDGGFWGGLQDVNAESTLAHCHDWMERLGWLANFDAVPAGTTGAVRPGWQFSDSEVYKLIEALAWEQGRTGSAWAEALLVSLVERVARAQDADGYLNTCFGHTGQQPRYSDLEEGHELYCVGHLLQAAVARLRTHGPDLLLEVARRAADEVCRTFGPGAREGLCGHPEIELGLVELGRALGEPRYVEQARVFVERRGRGLLRPLPLLSPTYFQDDVPVRVADVWRGHAVRALYLSAAAVDVAVECADPDLLAAVERQWTRSVGRRTYLTGGMGSRHQDEGFGDDWELPPDRAYCETCAGVASVMVSWRLYLATGQVRYVDLMERTYYNVVAASPRHDGRAFFYANPLQQRTASVDVLADEVNPRAEGGVRAPWFDVSCCPTNVARTLAAWQTTAVAVDGDVVSLLQYAPGTVDVALADGERVALRVRTEYPADGEVRVEVVHAPVGTATLRLRVPHWAGDAELVVGGEPRPVAPGWVDVAGIGAGDVVVLRLPVVARWTWADSRVDAVRGCVAVERGPVVLCLESTDLPPGVDLDSLRVDTDVPPRDECDGASVRARVVDLGTQAQPYGSWRPAFAAEGPAIDVRMIPYHRWAERGASTMRVFVPEAPAGA